ncbi:unnamed protein product, partial [Meganyctiphanes norvegica]
GLCALQLRGEDVIKGQHRRKNKERYHCKIMSDTAAESAKGGATGDGVLETNIDVSPAVGSATADGVPDTKYVPAVESATGDPSPSAGNTGAPKPTNVMVGLGFSKIQCSRNYVFGCIVVVILVLIAVIILRHGSKKHTVVVPCYTQDPMDITDMNQYPIPQPFKSVTPIGLNVSSSSEVILKIRTYSNNTVLHLNLVYKSDISKTTWVMRGNKEDSQSNWLQSTVFNATSYECIWRLNFILDGILLKVRLTNCEGLTHILNFWSEKFQPQGLFLEAFAADEKEQYTVFWGCYSVTSSYEIPKDECRVGKLTCGKAFSIYLIVFLIFVVILIAIYQKYDPQTLLSKPTYSRIQINVTDYDVQTK